MAGRGTDRRSILLGTAALSGAALPAPAARAQGGRITLRCAFREHEVPAANDALRRLCAEWAARGEAAVEVEFVPAAGNRLALSVAAEAQARLGHDLVALTPWDAGTYADRLEPLDDIMGRLAAAQGPAHPAAEYLCRHRGAWRAIPAVPGTRVLALTARLDLLDRHAGLNLRAMWPAAGRPGPGAEGWTWEAFIRAAEACRRAGAPFALPLGRDERATDWLGALFDGYGVRLADSRGQPAIRGNERLRRALELAARIARLLPEAAWGWSGAAADRAFVLGDAALVAGPPTAWFAARPEAPRLAETCWTLPLPAGPEGRIAPWEPTLLGLWSFGRQKAPAKALLEFLLERGSAQALAEAGEGLDIPPFAGLAAPRAWDLAGPPEGTLFNYPPRDHHATRPALGFGGAPYAIASQLHARALPARTLARMVRDGERPDQAMAWLEGELAAPSRGR